MNSLERLTKALHHQEADYVPVYPMINSVSRKALGLSYEEWTKDVCKCAQSIIKTTDLLDIDCISTLVDLSVEAADFGQELIYFADKAAMPNHDNHMIPDEHSYGNVQYVDPRTAPRMREHIELARLLVEARGKEKPVIGFVFGPLGILSMLRGQADLFMDMLTTPAPIHPALEQITKTLIDLCDALIDVGVHAIMFDTLFASISIMNEEMWDEFEGVYMEKICNHVHARGCMVMLHNCGKGAYFDAQIARMHPCLISFLHVPDGCDSYEEVKEKYGGDITLMGMLDPGRLFVTSEDNVRGDAENAIDIFAKGGGFVLSTGCEYPAPLDFTKARIMIDVAKHYGAYKK